MLSAGIALAWELVVITTAEDALALKPFCVCGYPTATPDSDEMAMTIQYLQMGGIFRWKIYPSSRPFSLF